MCAQHTMQLRGGVTLACVQGWAELGATYLESILALCWDCMDVGSKSRIYFRPPASL